MNVLFLSTRDIEDSRYIREGTKNLLETRFGIADTLAFCGKLERVGNTKYGPRLQINDGNSLSVIVGTFNNNVRKDAEEIVKNFEDGNKEIYLLLYGNPYETDKLYINVNQDNGVIVVNKDVFKKYHKMRKLAKEYRLKKAEILEEEKLEIPVPEEFPEELSDKIIIEFIKDNDRGNGVLIDTIIEKFRNCDRKLVEEKILELMELGNIYEPRSGFLKVIE